VYVIVTIEGVRDGEGDRAASKKVMRGRRAIEREVVVRRKWEAPRKPRIGVDRSQLGNLFTKVSIFK
jgi:hypothetical protein